MGNSDRRRELWREREVAGLCIYCGEKEPRVDAKGCESCCRRKVEVTKRFVKNHPDKQKAYRQHVRKAIIGKYGGRCKCCSESRWQFLTIDHKNEDGGAERTALYGGQCGASFSWFLKLRREPIREDLQVLCWNCNVAKHVFGTCPHECEKETDQGCLP